MSGNLISDADFVGDIVSKEVGVSVEELTEDTYFADLGFDDLLAKAIRSKLAERVGVEMPASLFDTCPTIGKMRLQLGSMSKSRMSVQHAVKLSWSTIAHKTLLSIFLQGQLASASKVMFLLPDGSGSGLAYAMLPRIDPSICLIALNSPYLQNSKGQSFSVEDIAAVWAEEIQRRQPQGPYFLGGWSAGGYYSFEVAKNLKRKGHHVEKLILIDSPCRLVYEELPMAVVHYLPRNNLMGNWGMKSPPQWMVDHFEISIEAISRYTPTPMDHQVASEILIIWAADGVTGSRDSDPPELDFSVKITRMLMQRPTVKGTLGWDALFPGAKM